MNVITPKVMDELEQVIDTVVADADDQGLRHRLGQERLFRRRRSFHAAAGAAQYAKALKEQGEDAANKQFFDCSRRLSLLYRKLETCGKPFAVAIHGVCLGGAFELALACHYRVMADDDKTKVGLPEIKVGLFPGAGGTQRVSRIMQTGDALQFLFKGDQIKPKSRARRASSCMKSRRRPRSSSAPAPGSSTAARRRRLGTRKDFKTPSGRVFSPTGMMIWPAANAIYRRETYDNYPAAKAILHAVYEGLQLPMDQALTVESRWFAHILRSKEAAAMIRSLFLSKNELDKGAHRPKDVGPTNLKKIGIIGAGFMGAGVAYISALNGLDVVLIDRDQESADKGKATIDKLISSSVSKGRATAADKDALLARVVATADYARAQRAAISCSKPCSRIARVKAEVTQARAGGCGRRRDLRLEHVDAADHLARGNHAEARELHRHPFLLAGREDAARRSDPRQENGRSRAGDGARLRPHHQEDADRRQRLARLLRQSLRAQLCSRRADHAGRRRAAGDDRECRAHGRHAGRAAVAQRRSRARSRAGKSCRRRRRISAKAPSIPRRSACCASWSRKTAASAARTARAFTTITANGTKSLWPGLSDLAQNELDPDTLDVAEMKQRFLVTQAVEAARTMAEGVVTDPREADVGSILGFGFAPFTGGVISYIDGMGAKAFVALCDKLAAKYGRASSRRNCCATWRRRAKPSTDASCRRNWRRRSASRTRFEAASDARR